MPLYTGMQFRTLYQATPVPARITHVVFANQVISSSNGYLESYTRPNNCHSKKVMFFAGQYYRMNNGMRARCPSVSTLYVHNRAHYMMSPTMDGDYDGGAGEAHTTIAPTRGEINLIPFRENRNQSFPHAYV